MIFIRTVVFQASASVRPASRAAIASTRASAAATASGARTAATACTPSRTDAIRSTESASASQDTKVSQSVNPLRNLPSTDYATRSLRPHAKVDLYCVLQPG
jgi:hypothetical protein